MKSRTWIVLIGAPIAVGVLGVVLQVLLSPSAYDLLSNVGVFLLVAVLAFVVLLIASAAARKRQVMRALIQAHPDALVQLASVMDAGGNIVTAGVLIDEQGLGFSSKEGTLRRVSWSQVTSITTSNWVKTLRTDVEINIDGETIRLIPISSWTLLPVSERRSAVFFDAIRKTWRLRGAPDAAREHRGD